MTHAVPSLPWANATLKQEGAWPYGAGYCGGPAYLSWQNFVCIQQHSTPVVPSNPVWRQQDAGGDAFGFWPVQNPVSSPQIGIPCEQTWIEAVESPAVPSDVVAGPAGDAAFVNPLAGVTGAQARDQIAAWVHSWRGDVVRWTV